MAPLYCTPSQPHDIASWPAIQRNHFTPFSDEFAFGLNSPTHPWVLFGWLLSHQCGGLPPNLIPYRILCLRGHCLSKYPNRLTLGTFTGRHICPVCCTRVEAIWQSVQSDTGQWSPDCHPASSLVKTVRTRQTTVRMLEQRLPG